MKKRMPIRKKLGKKSTYLKSFGSAHGGQSEFRSERRESTVVPNSTKTGKGKHCFRIRSRIQVKKAS